MELAIDAIAAARGAGEAGEAGALASSAALTTLESASSRLSLSVLEKEASTSVDAGDDVVANTKAVSDNASSGFARSFYPRSSSSLFDRTDLVSPMSSTRGEESLGLENGSMLRAFASRDSLSRVSGSDLYALARSGREVPEDELPKIGTNTEVSGELRFSSNMTSDDIKKLFLAKWAKVKEESAIPESTISTDEAEVVVPESVTPEVNAVDHVPESVADDVSDYQSLLDDEAEVVVPESVTPEVNAVDHVPESVADDVSDYQSLLDDEAEVVVPESVADDASDYQSLLDDEAEVVIPESVTPEVNAVDHVPESVTPEVNAVDRSPEGATPEADAKDLNPAAAEPTGVRGWLKKYGSHLFNVSLIGGPMIGQEVQSVQEYKNQQEQVKQQEILAQQQSKLESFMQGLASMFPRF